MYRLCLRLTTIHYLDSRTEYVLGTITSAAYLDLRMPRCSGRGTTIHYLDLRTDYALGTITSAAYLDLGTLRFPGRVCVFFKCYASSPRSMRIKSRLCYVFPGFYALF